MKNKIMKKILLTGGLGYIGSYFVNNFSNNFEFKILDTNYFEYKAKKINYLNQQKLKILEMLYMRI